MATVPQYNPTNLFTILKPQDQEIGEFYVVQECHATDFEAPKLWKGSSGSNLAASVSCPFGIGAYRIDTPN